MITTPNLSHDLGCPIIMSWWRLHCTGNASTTPRKPSPSETYGPALKHQWGDFWTASIGSYCFLHSRGARKCGTFFSKAARTGLDILMPEKQFRICTADAPWMTQRVKALILKRQKAFTMHGPESSQFKYLRNLVNRERKACRARYYESKVQQLKGKNPKKWWDEVKRLSGAKSRKGDLVKLINTEQFSSLSGPDQANAINYAFLEPLQVYKLHEPLAHSPWRTHPNF